MIKRTNENVKTVMKATESTDVQFVYPDKIVDAIHQDINRELYDKIETWIAYGIFTGAPIIKINLEYGDYIQIDKILEKHGFGTYILRLFISREDTGYVTPVNREGILAIINSIQNETFFKAWQQKIAMEDFDYDLIMKCVSLIKMNSSFMKNQ